MSTISSAFDELVNVGNKENQISQIFGELQKDHDYKDIDRDFVGANGNVGDGEFRALMGGVFNYKFVDKDKDGSITDGDIYINDAYNLLSEMLTGDGIEGVELIGLDGDSFTLAVDGVADSTDFMVFEGQAAIEAIELVDAEQGLSAAQDGLFDLNGTNKNNQFAILDLADESAFVKVGASGQLTPEIDTGNNLDAADVNTILTQVLTNGGYDSVELIDVDGSSAALRFIGTQSTDTLLIKNAGDLLDTLSGGPLNDFIKQGETAFNFEIDGPTNVPDGSLLDTFNFGNQINNNKNEFPAVARLLDALVEGGGAISDDDEVIELVGIDSDSFTIGYTQTVNNQQFTDYFVFDFA